MMRRQDWLRMEEYMVQCMKDSAHDMQHVRRVVNNALEIAAGVADVNMDVLMAAALLHDVGRADELVDPSVNHAVTGSERAYRLLKEMGYPESFAEHVRQCIRSHRFRNMDRPQTIEAKILYDADKLDVCGAVGVARTLMYSGSIPWQRMARSAMEARIAKIRSSASIAASWRTCMTAS